MPSRGRQSAEMIREGRFDRHFPYFSEQNQVDFTLITCKMCKNVSFRIL